MASSSTPKSRRLKKLFKEVKGKAVEIVQMVEEYENEFTFADTPQQILQNSAAARSKNLRRSTPTQKSIVSTTPLKSQETSNKERRAPASTNTNSLRPRVFSKTTKEELIASGLRCQPDEYPTMADVVSDWVPTPPTCSLQLYPTQTVTKEDDSRRKSTKEKQQKCGEQQILQYSAAAPSDNLTPSTPTRRSIVSTTPLKSQETSNNERRAPASTNTNSLRPRAFSKTTKEELIASGLQCEPDPTMADVDSDCVETPSTFSRQLHLTQTVTTEEESRQKSTKEQHQESGEEEVFENENYVDKVKYDESGLPILFYECGKRPGTTIVQFRQCRLAFYQAETTKGIFKLWCKKCHFKMRVRNFKRGNYGAKVEVVDYIRRPKCG